MSKSERDRWRYAEKIITLGMWGLAFLYVLNDAPFLQRAIFGLVMFLELGYAALFIWSFWTEE